MTEPPKQTTWVCVARSVSTPVRGGPRLYASVLRVLFIPIQETVLLEALVRVPVMWSPDADQEATLKEDWDTLTELLAEAVWRHAHGTALQ